MIRKLIQRCLSSIDASKRRKSDTDAVLGTSEAASSSTLNGDIDGRAPGFAASARWPVVYDSQQLKKQIKALIDGSTSVDMYKEDPNLPTVCQGDILSFASDVPIVGDSGRPSKIELPVRYWLVVGNTCDYERAEVEYLSISPILEYDMHSGVNVDSARKFETSRLFYIIPWERGVPDRLCADLTLTVAASKQALSNIAERHARMSWLGWLLLHCCLVRFFARDDGRHD